MIVHSYGNITRAFVTAVATFYPVLSIAQDANDPQARKADADKLIGEE